MDKIPKTIHYCWFGRGKKPKIAKKCIKSWKKYLPDYEIIEWNEDNFDINSNLYVKQAYEAKKYAFVSDYVRLYALYNYGGIYMDTDIQVLKSIDKLLENEAFTGYEDENYIACGIMGCKKGNLIFKEFLESYNERTFIKKDNSLDQTTIVKVMTDICSRYGSNINNTYEQIDGLTIYPKDYFYPISYNNHKKCFSSNTYTIHHYTASWLSEEVKKNIIKNKNYNRKKEWLCKFMSERSANIVLDFKWILKNKINKIIKQL